jgi:hypothetical protein
LIAQLFPVAGSIPLDLHDGHLSLAAWEFLEQLKYHRLILNSIVSNCAEGDTVAKSQEISRTWGDAASLVQSIVKKIGASLP